MAAIAAAACFSPVAAEVQPGTSSLLETIEDNGIVVTYNHPECATDGTMVHTVGPVSNVKLDCVQVRLSMLKITILYVTKLYTLFNIA